MSRDGSATRRAQLLHLDAGAAAVRRQRRSRRTVRKTEAATTTGTSASREWLRRECDAGRVRTMGEMIYVYDGIAPTDARLEPYWALAAELDIPVAQWPRLVRVSPS